MNFQALEVHVLCITRLKTQNICRKTYCLSSVWYLLVCLDRRTALSRVFLEKLTGPHLVKKFPPFYGTWKFITLFTRPPTCPYLDPDQFIPCSLVHFLNVHFNIILPSMPLSSRWYTSLRYPNQNPVCTSPLPHMCYVPHQSRFSLFHPLNKVWWEEWIVWLVV